MRRAVTTALLVLFTFVTVLGLPLFLTHPEHHHDCPLAQGAQLCKSSIIEHVSMWELLLASVLGVVVLVFGVFVIALALSVGQSLKSRYRHRTAPRPLLFQELYSGGILNRKEPYSEVVRFAI